MRRLLPGGLGGLTGIACVACCAIPLLLAAGVVGGGGWAFLGQVLPGVALGLAALTGLAWWWVRRRPACGCGGGCSCATKA